MVKILVRAHTTRTQSIVVDEEHSPAFKEVAVTTLVIYGKGGNCDVFLMEIQGQAQVAVAVAMLNKRHPKMLVKEGILYLAVSASNATIETLKKLEKISQMAEEEEYKRVIKNPTLQNVESFLCTQKLIRG